MSLPMHQPWIILTQAPKALWGFSPPKGPHSQTGLSTNQPKRTLLVNSLSWIFLQMETKDLQEFGSRPEAPFMF